MSELLMLAGGLLIGHVVGFLHGRLTAQPEASVTHTVTVEGTDDSSLPIEPTPLT